MIRKLNKIGNGKCADIYSDGNIAYKVIKSEAKTAYGGFYYKLNAKDLIDAKSDLCVYPFDFIADNDGNPDVYIMEYVPIIPFKEVLQNIPFDKLKQYIIDAEEKIEKDTGNHMIFNDVHENNIMWNTEKNCIQIIDTDFFAKNIQMSKEKLYSHNSYKFAENIEGMIALDFFDISHNNEEIIRLHEDILTRKRNNLPVSANEYLFKLKEVIENVFNKKFNSILEMKDAIEKRKEEIEDKEYEQRVKKDEAKQNLTLKQKLAIKMNNTIFGRMPFIKRFINKQMSRLPEVFKEDSAEDISGTDSENEFKKRVSDEYMKGYKVRYIDLNKEREYKQRNQSERTH